MHNSGSVSADPEFAELICEIAIWLFGDPNPQLSGATQWRYGTHGSLAIEIAGPRRGNWYDHQANEGGGITQLWARVFRIPSHAARHKIIEKFGQSERKDHRSPSDEVEAIYDYRDEKGTLTFQVIRYRNKRFRQRRPDGKGGWIWNIKGIQP